MAFPVELRVLISIVLVLILVPPASSLKNNHHYCPSSSCGNILNISYPFRLKGDPPNCGDQRYELSCDVNNHTLLSLHDGSKYYVSQINYNNYTIRIVDSGIQEDNYSFIPRYLLNFGNFSIESWLDLDPYQLYGSDSNLAMLRLSEVVVIVNCEKPVGWTSPSHFHTTSTNCSTINSKRYLYLIVGYRVNVMDVEESCTIEQMSLTSWPGQISVDPNISCTYIRNVFSYGFELSWYGIYCGRCSKYDDCYIDEYDNQVHCDKWGIIPTWVIVLLLRAINYAVKYTGLLWLFDRLTKLGVSSPEDFYLWEYQHTYSPSLATLLIGLLIEWHLPISVLGAPFVIAFFIYKWRRRHLSIYDEVEEFLQSQNNFMPIR